MNTTTNYGFKKPEATDYYDVTDFNDNMDTLDGELVKKLEAADIQARLTVAGWEDGEQTIQVAGITAASRGVYGPVLADMDAASECGIKPKSIGNGTVTFTCESTPDAAIAISFSMYKSDDGEGTGSMLWCGGGAEKSATIVAIPTVSVGTYTYDGSAKGPEVTIPTGYADYISITGATAVEPGTYTLTIALKNSSTCVWSDGSNAPKTYSYTIGKATGTITAPSAVSLTAAKLYEDVTITYNGDGVLSVVSDDTNIATTAQQSGSTYRITGKEDGSTTVTVSVPATDHYTAVSKVINVNCSLVSDTLNDNSWAVISKQSAAGTAASHWSVGDTKKIKLKGTVGTLSLDTELYVFILGFDHNSATEGKGISFGCFKTAQTGGEDVCLVDANYNSTDTTGKKWFNMNHQRSSASEYGHNYGGWKGCDCRYDILGSTDKAPSGYNTGSTYITTSRTGYDASETAATSPVANTLMAALPEDLRAVMKPITKYTDNKGNSSNAAANVTASIDYLPLLAEFEVQGARTYANENEKSSQKQYQYYINSNPKIKKKHSDTATAAYWFCRSATSSTAASFCRVYTDGSATYYYSCYSYGLAPAFLV